jgi:hypothetical protein
LCHCQTVPYRHAIADATRRERTARDASASSPGVGGSRLAAAIDAAQKRDRNTATSARGVR